MRTATVITSVRASSSYRRAAGFRPARWFRRIRRFRVSVRNLFPDFAHDARCEEPAKLTRACGRQRGNVDAAYRALFEVDRSARPNQAAGQLTNARLVTDERNAMAAMLL